MGDARKLLTLDWHDRFFAAEALLAIAFAAAAVAFVPFRWLGALASRGADIAVPPDDERLILARRVRWAVLAWARRVPWRALCFEQGLAAQMMLRRRGVPSVMYYGAAPDAEKGLAAHVWVRDGDTAIVGCETAPRFAVLATFPATSAQDGRSTKVASARGVRER